VTITKMLKAWLKSNPWPTEPLRLGPGSCGTGCRKQHAYVEAVEDALRAAPTLGGLVRSMTVGLVRRARTEVESYWHSQAVLLVTCEQRTS